MVIALYHHGDALFSNLTRQLVYYQRIPKFSLVWLPKSVIHQNVYLISNFTAMRVSKQWIIRSIFWSLFSNWERYPSPVLAKLAKLNTREKFANPSLNHLESPNQIPAKVHYYRVWVWVWGAFLNISRIYGTRSLYTFKLGTYFSKID